MAEPNLPPIISYHPEIQIDKAGERYVLKLVTNTYESDEAILKKLAVAFKVSTVGEIVEKLNAKKLPFLPHLRQVSVEKATTVPSAAKVWGWAEKVN
jgi:NAD-dependent DNA ligase